MLSVSALASVAAIRRYRETRNIARPSPSIGQAVRARERSTTEERSNLRYAVVDIFLVDEGTKERYVGAIYFSSKRSCTFLRLISIRLFRNAISRVASLKRGSLFAGARSEFRSGSAGEDCSNEETEP